MPLWKIKNQMRNNMKKRYYYHITQEEWAEEVVLSPRKVERQGDDEPKTARICVAPSTVHCFVALGKSLSEHGLTYVYRTKYKVKAESPFRVSDSHITKEMWLKTPKRFKRIKTFSEEELNSIYPVLPTQVGYKNRNVLANQRRSLNLLKKKLWYSVGIRVS
jgi:hypothetical protein